MKNLICFIIIIFCIFSCSEEIKKIPEPQKYGIVCGGVIVEKGFTSLANFPKTWNKEIKVTLFNDIQSFVTYPDTSGKYVFLNVPYGIYALTFEREKFKTNKIDSVMVNKKDTTFIRVPPFETKLKYMDVPLYKLFYTSITGFNPISVYPKFWIYLTFVGLNTDTNSYQPFLLYAYSSFKNFKDKIIKNEIDYQSYGVLRYGVLSQVLKYNEVYTVDFPMLYSTSSGETFTGDTIYFRAKMGGFGTQCANEIFWWGLNK